jgi:hypothetical protein
MEGIGHKTRAWFKPRCNNNGPCSEGDLTGVTTFQPPSEMANDRKNRWRGTSWRKHSGYLLQHKTTLHVTHKVYLCVPCDSHNTQELAVVKTVHLLHPFFNINNFPENSVLKHCKICSRFKMRPCFTTIKQLSKLNILFSIS